MNKEFLYMQKLAGIITESEYKVKMEEEIQILKEEVDISLELDQYIKDNPFNEENRLFYSYAAKRDIENKINRPLTPQEKSKITRLVDKYRYEYISKREDEETDAEDAADRKRYQSNLLPLTTDNGRGTPDSLYYELAFTYSSPDLEGNMHTSHVDPFSGYTDYKLRRRWINTPVDKATLDRYWHPGRLAMIGIKK